MSASRGMPPLEFGNLSSDEQLLPATRRELPPTLRRQPTVKREKSKSRPFVNLADSSEADTDADSDSSLEDVTTTLQVKKEKMTPKDKQRSQEKQKRRQSINVGNSSQDDTDDYDSEDGNPGPEARKRAKQLRKLAKKVETENLMQIIKQENEKVKREIKSEYPEAAASSSASAVPAAYSPEDLADIKKAEVMNVWAQRDAIYQKKRTQDVNDREAAEAAAKKAKGEQRPDEEEEDPRSYFGSAIDRPLYTGAAAFTVGVAQSGSDLARKATARAMKAFRDTGEAFHAYSSVADFSNIGTAAAIAASIGALTTVAEVSLGAVMPRQAARVLVHPVRLVGGAVATAVAARATMRYMDEAERNASAQPAAAAAASSSSAAAPSYESVFGNGQGHLLGGRSNPEDRAKVLQRNADKR